MGQYLGPVDDLMDEQQVPLVQQIEILHQYVEVQMVKPMHMMQLDMLLIFSVHLEHQIIPISQFNDLLKHELVQAQMDDQR